MVMAPIMVAALMVAMVGKVKRVEEEIQWPQAGSQMLPRWVVCMKYTSNFLSVRFLFCFVFSDRTQAIEYKRASMRLDAGELKQTPPLLYMQWASHCRGAPLQGAWGPWKGLETILYLYMSGDAFLGRYPWTLELRQMGQSVPAEGTGQSTEL